MTTPLPRPRAGLALRASILVLAAAPLVGCALFDRPLRDENNLLEARNQQLSQELAAERSTSSHARQRAESLAGEMELLRSRTETLEAENRRLSERVIALQSTLSDAQRASADSVAERLEGRMEEENRLRLRIESLEAELEGVRAARDVAEGRVRMLEERIASLEEENEIARTVATALRDDAEEARAERDATAEQLRAARAQVEEVRSDLEESRTALRTATADLESLRESDAAGRAARAAADQAHAGARARLAEAMRPFGSDAAAPSSGEARVLLSTDALFQPRSVLLSDRGVEILTALAGALEGVDFSGLRIEGHTDTVPVRNMPFVDNWDLGAGRSTAVARWLAARGQFDGKRLSAESYAYYRPLASNETEGGRRQNRRVEIILVP